MGFATRFEGVRTSPRPVHDTTGAAKTLDDYKVVLYRNQPSGRVAEVPTIEGCYALMPTREAALTELQDVFTMIAAECEEKGLPLPSDTTEIVHA
jgi:predicted RNase H-like HicB family nuclease